MTIAALGSLFLIIVLSLYMLMDSRRILGRLRAAVPRRYRDEADLFERSIVRAFGGFLRAQLILAGDAGAAGGRRRHRFGIPYLFLWGTISALAMLIPFFGPPLALLPPIVGAVLFAGGAAIPVAIILLVVQTVMVNWLQPRLMRGALGLHPILVLVGLLLGAQVAGVWGALFGIPVIAVLWVFVSYARLPHAAERGAPRGRAALRRRRARHGQRRQGAGWRRDPPAHPRDAHAAAGRHRAGRAADGRPRRVTSDPHAERRRGLGRHPGRRRTSSGVTSSAKWQALMWPPPMSRSGGSSVLQISCAIGHRVWKRHPDGGLAGDGRSPFSTIRSRRTVGSGTGMADSSALVYGCAGLRYSSSASDSSTSLPRYMTPTRVREVLHDRQVVRDEQVGQLELVLEVAQQVQHLRLDRARRAR